MLLLDDKFAIEADNYNIILLRKKSNGNYKKIGFFRTLESALKKYLDENIKENIINNNNNIQNIKDIILFLKNFENNLKIFIEKNKEKLDKLKTKYN